MMRNLKTVSARALKTVTAQQDVASEDIDTWVDSVVEGPEGSSSVEIRALNKNRTVFSECIKICLYCIYYLVVQVYLNILLFVKSVSAKEQGSERQQQQQQ
jgi:hypothetical protein